MSSQWALDEFWMSSACVLNEFCMSSEWILDEFRMSPEWILHDLWINSERVLKEFRIDPEWILNGFWMNYAWFSNELYMESEWVLDGLWMGSEQGTSCLSNRLPVEVVACKHEFLRLSNLVVRVLCWDNVYTICVVLSMISSMMFVRSMPTSLLY